LTGLEKLQKLFMTTFNASKRIQLFGTEPNLQKNSKILAFQLQRIKDDSATLCLQIIIKQGILDGSIKSEYPKELSEVMLILINFWLNPVVSSSSIGAIKCRFRFYNEFLLGLGVNLFNEEVFACIDQYCDNYSQSQ
jgi:hypothetical protein